MPAGRQELSIRDRLLHHSPQLLGAACWSLLTSCEARDIQVMCRYLASLGFCTTQLGARGPPPRERLGHLLHRPVPPLCKPQHYESLGHPSGGGPPGALPGRSVARLERRCFLGKGVKGARGPPRPRACGRSRQGSTLPSSPRSILKDPSQWRKKKHTWGGMSCKKSSSNT